MKQLSMNLDEITERPVFRDGSGNLYTFEKDDGDEISYDEYGIIVIEFFKRILEDASGPTLANNLVTKKDQDEAREFLIEGCLKRNGYFQYFDKQQSGLRNYEDSFVRFIETEEEQTSTISLDDIATFTNLDIDVIKQRIISWANKNWVRDCYFYENAMEVL